MKYQVIAAEEKWATTYYHFLQSQKRELTGEESAIEIIDDSPEAKKIQELHGEQMSQEDQLKSLNLNKNVEKSEDEKIEN